MNEKITGILTTTKKVFGRKVIMAGVLIGIGIGVLLDNKEEEDVLIFETQIDLEEDLPSYNDGEDKDVPVIDQ